MTGTTNIDQLIELLNASESILRFNTEVENNIRQHSGTILYSFNNIIIASEISDSLYDELLKDPYIDYIQDLPLKKYGAIDVSLIDQLDINKINLSPIDGVSGVTQVSINNIENNIPSKGTLGIPPTITNSILSLSALTNQWFYYEIFVSGTLQINLDYITPVDYNGILDLKNNKLSGKTFSAGIYNIPLKAVNNYGFDVKYLNLTVFEPVKITNTNLLVYNKVGTQFSYTIIATGTPPIIYNATNIPSGITINNNIMTGVFSSGNTYNVKIIASGLTNSDSKDLTIITGYAPIITSAGHVNCTQYSNFIYTITSTDTAIYTVLGILPTGLQFNISTSTISGIPIYDGSYDLKIKANNNFGESIKDLNIVINQM